MTESQIEKYDLIVNEPENDWDIYYWMTESKSTPSKYDNEVMDMLKEHAKNPNKMIRSGWPELK